MVINWEEWWKEYEEERGGGEGGKGAGKSSAGKVEWREKPHKEVVHKEKKAVKESVGQEQIIIGEFSIQYKKGERRSTKGNMARNRQRWRKGGKSNEQKRGQVVLGSRLHLSHYWDRRPHCYHSSHKAWLSNYIGSQEILKRTQFQETLQKTFGHVTDDS